MKLAVAARTTVVGMTSALALACSGGGTDGSLRCVSGVCRVLPPFEGARLDATLRL